MIPTHVIPYRHGELRIGWASWDDGKFTERSIKFAYRDKSGKVSRGSPEIPFDMLADMIDLALTKKEVQPPSYRGDPDDVKAMSKPALIEERKAIAARLGQLMVMVSEMPWAPFQKVYDRIGLRYEELKEEIALRP